MTDRFSHPLSMGLDHNERARQPASHAHASSRTSGSGSLLAKFPNEAKPRRTSVLTGSKTSNDPPSNSNYGHERSTSVHTRSRASTILRARIPKALQGIGREELEIYQNRWDLMSDDQLLRACGSSSAGLPPSPLRTQSDSTLLSATLDSRSSDPNEVPRLSSNPSSSSSPGTPRARPRPAKRYSTQILALTLPPVRAEPIASSSKSTVELFPPSPPSDSEAGLKPHASDEANENDRSDLISSTEPVDRLDSTDRHPLRILSKIARELGESCLRLEEENELLRAKLDRQESGEGSQSFTPRRRSTSLGQALNSGTVDDGWPMAEAHEDIFNELMEEDQLSIHDSLNEALSTSLSSPAALAFSTRHSRQNHNRADPLTGEGDDDDDNDDNHSVTVRAKAGPPSYLLHLDSPARSLAGHPRRTRVPGSIGRDRSGSTSTNASRNTRPPTIVVRSTASEAAETEAFHEEAVLDGDLLGTVPQPKNKKHRSSWTESLWGWTSGAELGGGSSEHRSISNASRKDNESISTNNAQARRSRASILSSEPAVYRKPLKAHTDNADVSAGEEDWSFRFGDGSNTPTFRAIFLATRLLTPDTSSILSTASKHRRDGELIRRMAYKLVRNARDSGIALKPALEMTKPIPSTSPNRTHTKISSKTSKRHSVLGIPSAIGSALASPVQALLGSGTSTALRGTDSESAGSQLLRTISNRDMAGTLNSSGSSAKGKSPDRSAVNTPLVSPGDDSESAPPFVEMNAFVADRDKPPPMLPRRHTLHKTHAEISPSFKIASRFGDESAELAPYTDKFGFVYDLRYVRLLLDLKAASEEDTLDKALTDGEEMPQVKRDPWRSDDGAVLERVHSTSCTSPATSPLLEELDDPATPSADASKSLHSEASHVLPRPRSSTVAAFSPSPAKASASQQDITVSSRGAVNLRPSISTNGGRKDSVRDQKAKLDLLAVRQRKPVSALLHQLGEVQDIHEAETAKEWEQFIRYRRGKKPRKGSVSQKHKPISRLDAGSWHDDLVGIADIGDGKTGQEVMRKFRALIVSSGIPINLRASIWAECSGAKEAFIPGEYHEILSVHKHDMHPVLGDIEKDVKRTFPTNVFFGGDGVGCEKLSRVLTAYAWHDPSVGYCQGMNLVAATLLLIYGDEERAYWTFVCLIRNLLPQEWFTRTLQGSMAEQAVLADLVAEYLPKIDRHFAEIGLDLSAVTFGWMLSLFTNCLPIETVLRIWDCFMIEGKDVIIRSALAILKMGQGGIIECDNVGDLFDYLNAITERLWSPDKLIQTQNDLKITIPTHDLAARRQKHADTNTTGSV